MDAGIQFDEFLLYVHLTICALCGKSYCYFLFSFDYSLCRITSHCYAQALRDGPTNKVRARMSVASAVIFGSVFWRMGKTQASIQDRMGLLQACKISTLNHLHLIIYIDKIHV